MSCPLAPAVQASYDSAMQTPPPPPTLVMLAGVPGTGKTTLAYALAQTLRWPVLDKDLLNGVLLDAGLHQPQAGPLTYELLLTLCHDLVVRQQQSIILDTAGRLPFILQRAQTIAQAAHGQLRLIRCVAPAIVRAQRLAARLAGPSQWATNKATDAHQEQWYAHLPPETLTLSTERPLAENIATALAFLDRGQHDG